MARAAQASKPAPAQQRGTTPRFNEDEDAFQLAGNVHAAVIGLVVIMLSIITAVVGMSLLSSQLGGFFKSGKQVVENFTKANIDNGGVGDTTVHSFGLIAALLIAIAPIGLLIGLVLVGKGYRKGSRS